MPAEQLVNLYQDTVASGGYTSGSGVLNVSSGAGAPSSGPFTLTILEPNGGSPETYSILLLFRVSAVNSATQFAGAAEGPDVSAPAGCLVIGTTLSVAAINNLFSFAGFLQPLTAPVAANLTAENFNTGSCVTTQNNNTSPVTSITLTQSDPSATGEIAALVKSPINAEFTLTIGCSIAGIQGSGGTVTAGLWLWDGGVNSIAFILNSGNGFEASVYNNLQGAFVGNVFAEATAPLPTGPLVWFRVQETASNRLYSYSADGINFFQIASESNTAHFTTNKYGFMAECRSAGGLISICCYSMVETHP
jgi:hypothetical protein